MSKYTKDLNERVLMALNGELKKQAMQAAAREKLSLSNWIRSAMQRQLEAVEQRAS
jgi:hypothetical protein